MQENMQNLAKYAAHTCSCGIFSAYFQHTQLRATENHNHDH